MVVRDAPIVSHVEHTPEATRPRRVEVVEVRDLTPRMRRVRLAVDQVPLALREEDRVDALPDRVQEGLLRTGLRRMRRRHRHRLHLGLLRTRVGFG